MKATVILLGAIVLLLLAGVVPGRGPAGAWFTSPVFLGLWAVLAAALVACACRRPWTWRSAGFRVLHLAVAAILCGAALRFAFGRSTECRVPVNPAHETAAFPTPQGPPLELPFGVSVTDFQVRFYPPTYALHAPPATPGGGYRRVRTVDPGTRSVLDLGPGGRVPVSELVDPATGEWRPHVLVARDWMLERLAPVPAHYEARLRLRLPGQPPQEEILAVNHPVHARGWRLTLMSYDTDARRFVVLGARRDPGRPLVVAGLWLLIAGTAALCWMPRRPAAPGPGEGATGHG